MSLINQRFLVCPRCLDEPQEQLRVVVLPPDPDPVINARPEQYAIDEGAQSWSVVPLLSPAAPVGPGTTSSIVTNSVPNGDMIIVCVHERGASGAAAPGVVTDSSKNNYVILGTSTLNNPNSGQASMFACPNAKSMTGGVSTINYIPNGPRPNIYGITAFAISPAPDTIPGAIDVFAINNNEGTSVPAAASTPRPRNVGDLFIGVLITGTGTVAITQVPGWTALPNAPDGSGSEEIFGGYLIDSVGGAQTYNPSVSNIRPAAAFLFGFINAAPG